MGGKFTRVHCRCISIWLANKKKLSKYCARLDLSHRGLYSSHSHLDSSHCWFWRSIYNSHPNMPLYPFEKYVAKEMWVLVLHDVYRLLTFSKPLTSSFTVVPGPKRNASNYPLNCDPQGSQKRQKVGCCCDCKIKVLTPASCEQSVSQHRQLDDRHYFVLFVCSLSP